MSRPWFSRPADERRELALELVDELVEVDVDPFRDGDVSSLVGRLVAAPLLMSGTTRDVVVIRRTSRPDDDLAVSLAQVREIRLLEPASAS